MFTRIEANRLRTNDDYNTADSLAVSARVDEFSDQPSVDVVKADFGLYQSQNARVEHSVLREQPQYLLVADKPKPTPAPAPKPTPAPKPAPTPAPTGDKKAEEAEARLRAYDAAADAILEKIDKANEKQIEEAEKAHEDAIESRRQAESHQKEAIEKASSGNLVGGARSSVQSMSEQFDSLESMRDSHRILTEPNEEADEGRKAFDRLNDKYDAEEEDAEEENEE